MRIIFESFFVSSDVLADISVTNLRNMGLRMLRKQTLLRFERIIWKNNKEVRHVNSRGEAIIRGKRLFQMLHTGSRALNILFYDPIKSKNYQFLD